MGFRLTISTGYSFSTSTRGALARPAARTALNVVGRVAINCTKQPTNTGYVNNNNNNNVTCNITTNSILFPTTCVLLLLLLRHHNEMFLNLFRSFVKARLSVVKIRAFCAFSFIAVHVVHHCTVSMLPDYEYLETPFP